MIDRRLFLGACAAAAPITPMFAHAAAAEPVSIPFLLTRNRAIMLIGINGKGPYKFVIDTGNATPMAVSDKLAKELQLPETNSVRVGGLVGHGIRKMYAAEEVNFGGGLRQRHVGFEELRDINDLGYGSRGLVAAQFFLSRPSEIDFEQRLIRLWLNGGGPDRTGFTAIRLQPPSNVEMVVDGQFDGAPCRLKLDSGAPGALTLNAAYVARRGLWNAYPKFRTDIASGVTSSAMSRQVRASSLKFGPFTFKDPFVELVDPQAPPPPQFAENTHDGLLGIDILRRFTLSIDGNGHTVWVKGNDALGDAYRVDRAGLRLGLNAEGEVRVGRLSPNSPAAKAGLKMGDRLEGVTKLSEIDDLQWRLSGYAGDVVDVEVAGPSGPEKRSITLVDPL